MITNEVIQAYCESLTSPQDAVLTELERQTHLSTTQPHMLSGNFQGQLLTMICQMLQANFILEIGTFTGYSAICLARGLSENGQLHSIDPDIEKRALVEKAISSAGLSNKIQLWSGFAKDILLENLSDMEFDLIFIDADKENYALYYDLCLPLLRKGGIIMIDNMLWKGKVIDQIKDKKTTILDNFNQKIADDESVTQILLPIRDGLMMVRKK